MKIFTTGIFCCFCFLAFSQQVSKKTFIISSSVAAPTLYNHISSIDINAGKLLDDIYDLKKKYSIRNNGYRSYGSVENKKDSDEDKNKNQGNDLKTPLAGSVACMAYDQKNNRLFYIPQQLSE